MSNKNDKKIPLWAQIGHQRPTTRREMLASGTIPFAAKLLVPNWVNLLLGAGATAAEGDDDECAKFNNGMMPLMTLNLAGGAGLMANFVPHDMGRQKLGNYDLMGLGDGNVPIEMAFGKAPFAGNGISKFLKGFKAGAKEAYDKTSFVAVCVQLKDDTKENKLSIDGMAQKAGLVGQYIRPNYLGVRGDTTTGIGMNHALIQPATPLIVSSLMDLMNSVGYTGHIGAHLSPEQKVALAKTIKDLSWDQMSKLGGGSHMTQVKKVIHCAGIQNHNNMANPESAKMDPRKDADVRGVWGITETSALTDKDVIFSAMTHNVLNGNVGAAGLELGGYDYHNGTRTLGDSKDEEAGLLAGKIMQTAMKKNKTMFLYVTTDGSVASTQSNMRDSAWVWDRGAASVAYMLVFDPAGRPATSDFQIGHFKQGQVAADDFMQGWNAEMAAVGVFANWMKLSGKSLALVDTITGSKISRTDLENNILKFK